MKTLPKTLPAFFWHFLKKQWKEFAGIQLFSLAWSLDHTLWPYIMGIFIDGLNGITGDRSQMWSILWLPITLGISLMLIVELSFRLSGFLGVYSIPKLEGSVRMGMFDYVQHHSYAYFSRSFAGSIANKLAEMPLSFTRIIEQVLRLYIPVLVAIFISIILFSRVHMQFSLMLAAWIFIHLGICAYFARKCANFADDHAESRSLLTGKIVDSLSNHLNVKLFARHTAEVGYIWKFQNLEAKAHSISLLYLEKMKLALGFFSLFGIGFGMIGYMLLTWQRGEITTGEVVFIFNTIWNITMMVWLFGLELPNTVRDFGVCKQALSVIRDTHDVVDISNARPLVVSPGEIVFDNVTFNYEDKKTIFQNKNIKIKAGEKVGLVGFSGSGKTTFVHLILRYFDLASGRILIDGQDIAKVTQESLRAQIAMIPQDPILFHRSLMENIRYGKPGATDEEVIEASKRAHCHDFIMQMPEKYDALVGERGVKLSGGQRQRIAIARAILKNAPILMLDEATSALDSVTEGFIQDSLNELMQGRTTIVIAHRLSTLSGMDRIIVFKSGKVVEEGTHEALVELGGHYAKMWEMQAGGFLPEDWDEEEEEPAE